MCSGLIPFAGMEVGFTDDPMGRVSLNLYICGCSLNCSDCCNSQLQDSANAKEWLTVEQLFVRVVDRLSRGLAECVVFLGGDWVERSQLLIELAWKLYRERWPLILYTGREFWDLHSGIQELMEVVVDGQWEKDLVGVFPPSTNQRVFVAGACVISELLPLYKILCDRKAGESPNVVS